MIKDKVSLFRDVEADKLRLYSILIPGPAGDDDEHLEDGLEQLSLADQSCLDSRAKVSKLFPESDEGEEKWLVVDGPNAGAPSSRYSVALLTTNFTPQVRTSLPVNLPSTSSQT